MSQPEPLHQLLQAMETRLRERLLLESLEIIDDSDRHRGHVGAATGKKHMVVMIRSRALSAMSRVEAHRLVYAALGSLMSDAIHALSIQIRAE